MPFIRSHTVAKADPLRPSTPVLTRESAQRLDRAAEQRFQIPLLTLMENAARAASELALHLIVHEPSTGVLVVSGNGNNGADGLAAARLIANTGRPVAVLLASASAPSFQSPFSIQLRLLHSMNIPIFTPQDSTSSLAKALESIAPVGLLIDAIAGTGLAAPLRPSTAALIHSVNALRQTPSPPLILSLDLPSGMDADTGEELGAVIIPDATVTFAAPKKGMLSTRLTLGDLYLSDLGLPATLIAEHTETAA